MIFVQEIVQENFCGQLFAVLVPTHLCLSLKRSHSPLTDSSSHVQNVRCGCEGVERSILLPFLDPIIERWLKLLNPTGENATQPKCYVQEQYLLWSPMQVRLLSPR